MNLLIGIHAGLGEMGALAFLWVLVELLNPTESRLRRARIAAAIGTSFLLASWVTGGIYYLTDYQAVVKPVIKAGPLPWAHSVITETKEHLFLFLPFLAVLVWGMLSRFRGELVANRGLRFSVILCAGLIVLMAFSMAGMGYVISSGFRAALEAKVL